MGKKRNYKPRSGAVESCTDSSINTESCLDGISSPAEKARMEKLDPIYPEETDINGDPNIDWQGGLDV